MRCFIALNNVDWHWEPRDVRLPNYDELIEEQLDVMEVPFDQSLFVAGPPGSGKTVLAVRRALTMATANVSAVLVTYNRMLRRLVALLTEGKVQAFTMHSFVGQRHYGPKTGSRQAPEVRRNEFDWEAMTKALVQRGVQPDALHMIVDEGQDLPRDFYAYTRRFVAETISVFVDEDQALSDQRSTLRDIKRAAELDDPILLKGNHRNTPEVAKLAEHFHTGIVPSAQVHRPPSGERPRLVLYPTVEEASERIANWHAIRGGSAGVVVVHNQTGRELRQSLHGRLEGHRVGLYTFDQTNEDEIDVTKPGITILNKKSIKGQEFDTVFIMEVDELLPCTTDAQSRVMYMLCARARDNLFLMHHGSRLPVAVLRSLPGADVLERP